MLNLLSSSFSFIRLLVVISISHVLKHVITPLNLASRIESIVMILSQCQIHLIKVHVLMFRVPIKVHQKTVNISFETLDLFTVLVSFHPFPYFLSERGPRILDTIFSHAKHSS